MKKKILAVFFCLSVFVLTFLRENIFLEINGILNQSNFNKAYFYLFHHQFQKLSIQQLVITKWTLTFVFVFLITLFSILVIKFWFNQAHYTKMMLTFYGLFFLVSLSVIIILFFIKNFNDYYFVLRKMVGLFSSPLPLFLFFVKYYYLNSISNNTKK